LKLTKANTRILESLLPRLNLNVEEPERTEIEHRLQADLYEAQRSQKPFETVHGQSPEEQLDQMIAEIPERRRVETQKRWTRNYVSTILMFIFIEGIDGIFQFALADYILFSIIALFLIDAMSILITSPKIRLVKKRVWAQFLISFMLFATYKAVLITFVPNPDVLIQVSGTASYVIGIAGLVGLYIYWSKNPLRKRA
jgi:hypothetical protein